jgi:hypothetical protein
MSPGYGSRVRLRARCPLSAACIASARALTAKGTVPSQVIAKFKIEIAMAYTVWAFSGHLQTVKVQVDRMCCWSAAHGFSLTRKRPQVQILYRPQVTTTIRKN